MHNLALQSVTTRPNSTNVTEELDMQKLRTYIFPISKRLRHTLRIEKHCCKILDVRESVVGDTRNTAASIDYYRKWRLSAWWRDCKSRVPKPGTDRLARSVDMLSLGTL